MEDKEVYGVVNDIQRSSVNDGPGIRTVVFLKGCYLNCRWCHNPEGKRRYPEVIPYFSNCIGCGDCLDVCPTGAISLNEDKKPQIDMRYCITCLQCIMACPHDGLILWGKIMSIGDVMKEVEEDKLFYGHSDGGMTLSGGEPMAQPDFARALMKAAKEEGIGTALDTSGHAPWADYERVLEYTDLVLFDIKDMNSKAHKEYAGFGNELILENAKLMADKGVKMRIRVPVIPGMNDSTENMEKTAQFIETLGQVILGVDLLTYHPFAAAKYNTFGIDYPFPVGEGMPDEKIKPIIELFLNYVEEVTVGG